MVHPAFAAKTQSQRPSQNDGALTGKRRVGFMLAHEQFAVPRPLQLDETAAMSGFDVLAASDHFSRGRRMKAIAARPGATIVNIHSGQSDQQKVIDFYGNWVLPQLAGRGQGGIVA